MGGPLGLPGAGRRGPARVDSARRGRRPPFRRPGAVVRSVRRASRTPNQRAGLCDLLAIDPAAHAAALRTLWRPAAVVARHQRAALHVSSLPPASALCRSRRGGRPVRRGASGRRPRDQVRGPAVAGPACCGTDAATLPDSARGRGRRGPRAASSVAAPVPRIQPGIRPRAASRPARGPCAHTHTRHPEPDRPARGAAASQHARRVRAGLAGSGRHRNDRGAGGRCEHDGSDDRRVRPCPDADGRAGSSSRYSSASRDATALSTSVAMADFGRSPSRTSQPCSAACRL